MANKNSRPRRERASRSGKRSPREKFTQADVIFALEQSAGIRLAAALQLKCSRSTITNYVDRYPEVKAALDEILENQLDIVESKLMKRLRDDANPSVQANCIQFYLKTKGSSRGYGIGTMPRTLKLDVPKVENVADVAPAMATVFDAVTTGEITPEQGRQLSDLLELRRKALVDVEQEARIAAIEKYLAELGLGQARH
jgi:hypothetical protein